MNSRPLSQPNKINLVVSGASGRMGRLVCAEALQPQNQQIFQLVAALTHPQSKALGQPCVVSQPSVAPLITAEYAGPTDVVIAFSIPAGLESSLQFAQKHHAALLIATTGYDNATTATIKSAADRIPILTAANTSLGINIIRQLATQVTQMLGPDTRIEIIEAHHQHKKDAPSGTALALGSAVAEGGGHLEPEQYHALRGGGVIGEHAVRFFADHEYLELRHVATSRRLFAVGALQAASWLAAHAHQPRLYTMDEVLAK